MPRTPKPDHCQSLAGCDRTDLTRGFCRMHYQQELRAGNMTTTPRKPTGRRAASPGEYYSGPVTAPSKPKRSDVFPEKTEGLTRLVYVLPSGGVAIADAINAAETNLDVRLAAQGRAITPGAAPVFSVVRANGQPGTSNAPFVVLCDTPTVPIPRRAYREYRGT